MKVVEKNVMRLAAVQHLRAVYGIKIKNWSKHKAASSKSNSVSKPHGAVSRLNSISIKRLNPPRDPHLFGGRCHPCLSLQILCLGCYCDYSRHQFLDPKAEYQNAKGQRPLLKLHGHICHYTLEKHICVYIFNLLSAAAIGKKEMKLPEIG